MAKSPEGPRSGPKAPKDDLSDQPAVEAHVEQPVQEGSMAAAFAAAEKIAAEKAAAPPKAPRVASSKRTSSTRIRKTSGPRTDKTFMGGKFSTLDMGTHDERGFPLTDEKGEPRKERPLSRKELKALETSGEAEDRLWDAVGPHLENEQAAARAPFEEHEAAMGQIVEEALGDQRKEKALGKLQRSGEKRRAKEAIPAQMEAAAEALRQEIRTTMDRKTRDEARRQLADVEKALGASTPEARRPRRAKGEAVAQKNEPADEELFVAPPEETSVDAGISEEDLIRALQSDAEESPVQGHVVGDHVIPDIEVDGKVIPGRTVPGFVIPETEGEKERRERREARDAAKAAAAAAPPIEGDFSVVNPGASFETVNAKGWIDETRTAHAAAEEQPNSANEQKKKLEALFDLYGPALNYQTGALADMPEEKTPEPAPEPEPTVPAGPSHEETVAAYRAWHKGEGTKTTTPEVTPRTEAEHKETVEAFKAARRTPEANAAIVAAQERAQARMGKAQMNAEYKQKNEKLLTTEKQFRDRYFQALKASQHRRSFWSTLGERVGIKGKDHDPLGQLDAFRKQWLAARHERASLLLNSIDERREGRGGKKIEGLKKYKGRESLSTDAVRERYQRRFIVKEVFMGAEEEEQRVRMAGIEGRNKNLVDKAFKWYDNLSPKGKLVFGGSLLTLGTVAGIGFTGGLGLAAAGFAGAGAASMRAGWVAENRRERAQKIREGVAAKEAAVEARRTAGEFKGNFDAYRAALEEARAEEVDAKRQEKVANRYGLLGKLLMPFATAGSIVVGGSAELAQKGRRKESEETLTSTEYADIRDKDAFDAGSKGRIEAAKRKDRIDNRTKVARRAGATVGSIAGGALVGGAIKEMGGGSGGHHGHDAVPGGKHHGHGSEGSPTPRGSEGSPTPAEHGHPHGFRADINQRGEGADHLYRDLRSQIEHAYGKNPTDVPPVIKQILAYKNMDDFSRANGFENFPLSGVMHLKGFGHPADAFQVSADGKSFDYIDSYGTTHPLMRETPDHTVDVMHHDKGWIPMRPTHHHHGTSHGRSHEAPASNTTRGDAAGDAKVAGLNNAQVPGREAPAAAVVNNPPTASAVPEARPTPPAQNSDDDFVPLSQRGSRR